MRGHAAVGRQDPRRVNEPVDVVRRRLPADEDDLLAGPAALLGRVRVEDDLPAGRARRCVQALRRNLPVGGRVEHRVQELVELLRVDPCNRLLAGDQFLLDHVDRRLHRRRRRPFRRPRLQEVQVTVLHRELDVLHVAVVLLEPVHGREQLLERLWQPLFHVRQRLRRADARDDVLALRVGQELAVQSLLAGRGIARERDASA
jgi:hypothetical protein